MVSNYQKVVRKIKKMVEQLPSDTFYLIRHNYIVPKDQQNKVTQLTILHNLNRQPNSILFRLIEEITAENDVNVITLTLFEVLLTTNDTITISTKSSPTIIAERIDKITLFQEILPTPHKDNTLAILHPMF